MDLDKLLRLRLVVARIGEMDNAKWWNTNEMLGRRGKIVLSRGFPGTHYFAQARVVFAVAKSRCQEVFDPPGCMTLWSLPAELEDQFEEHWPHWIDEIDEWKPFFEDLAPLSGSDVLTPLKERGLITEAQAEEVSRFRRSAEGRAVPVPGVHQPNDHIIALLAAGFAKGETGSLAIPYARLEN